MGTCLLSACQARRQADELPDEKKNEQNITNLYYHTIKFLPY